MDGIEAKMQKLVETFDDARGDQRAEVQAMQKSLKQAMLKKDFKSHPAMQLMLATLQKREQAYTLVLANKQDLNELDRKRYFGKREEIRWVLSFFAVESTIENIDKQLDYQLSDAVDSGGDS